MATEDGEEVAVVEELGAAEVAAAFVGALGPWELRQGLATEEVDTMYFPGRWCIREQYAKKRFTRGKVCKARSRDAMLARAPPSK